MTGASSVHDRCITGWRPTCSTIGYPTVGESIMARSFTRARESTGPIDPSGRPVRLLMSP